MVVRTVFLIWVVLVSGAALRAQGPGYPGAPVREYYQPVRILGPEGTRVSFAIDGKFVARSTTPHAVGLLVGGDYRLRITDIPFYPGREIYPTLKIIGRTFPPRGQELEFPILVELTQEDLELALNGRFITRVVYLEDPQTAMPIRSDLGQQLSTDAAPGTDPVDLAATMGRPVAILRLGGRLPGREDADSSFFLGCPPWVAHDKTPAGRYETTIYRNSPRKAAPAYQVGGHVGVSVR